MTDKKPPSGWWIGPALVISAAMWIGAIWALVEEMTDTIQTCKYCGNPMAHFRGDNVSGWMCECCIIEAPSRQTNPALQMLTFANIRLTEAETPHGRIQRLAFISKIIPDQPASDEPIQDRARHLAQWVADLSAKRLLLECADHIDRLEADARNVVGA